MQQSKKYVPRAGLSKQSVIDSATIFINQQGLENLTLGKLAKSLNIKPPSLYNHVSSLENLKQELALKGARLLKEDLQNATVGKAKEDALSALAKAYRQFGKNNPGLFQATLRHVEDQNDALKTAGYDLLRILLAVLAGFGVKDNDALHAIRSLRASLAGFVMLELNNGFGMPLDVDESFERLIAMHIEQLKH